MDYKNKQTNKNTSVFSTVVVLDGDKLLDHCLNSWKHPQKA